MRSIVVFLLSLVFASSGHAFNASGNSWELGQATFHVGISGQSPSGGSWNAAFIRSMDAWTNATGFEFLAVEDFHDPCIDNGEDEFGDDINGVDFTTTLCGTEFGDSTLAVTLSAGVCTSPACDSFYTTNADIVFNEGETWDVYSGDLRSGIAEFERVALHELGHALGLDHETSNIAMMQSTVSNLDSLQIDDINGANFIYQGEATFASVYGVDIILPAVSKLSNSNTSISFNGNLTHYDAALDAKFIDLYQYTFENDSTVAIRANSDDLNTFLYLVRISSTQEIIPDSTFSNDDFFLGSNARISQDIQAGTYWIGVSSADENEVGAYDVSINAFNQNPALSFESFTSIYGIEVEINPNPSILGTLTNSDFEFEGKFLDLYQFQVNSAVELRFDLGSNDFDTNLLLIEVDAEQQPAGLVLENDDNGINSNSRIEQTLAAGTYWIGVTSFAADETGDYNIEVSVVLP